MHGLIKCYLMRQGHAFVNNVFSEGELTKDSAVAKFATAAEDGKTYQVEY